jgi:hypothetical protein
MQLLGPYKSNIAQWYYQQLLSILNQAVAAGDYGGGSAFNQQTLQALVNQAQSLVLSFPSTANTTVLDEDFNYPTSILSGQYAAIQSELNQFVTNVQTLISVLEKDTVLLEYLLNQGVLGQWMAEILIAAGAITFSWDFNVGYGKSVGVIPNTDPTNLVVYPNSPVLDVLFDTADSLFITGLLPATNNTIYSPNNLAWTYTTPGLYEVNYDENNTWTDISFLVNEPQLTFLQPSLEVLLPATAANVFTLSGVSTQRGIPIYVRTLFQPRGNQTTLSSEPVITNSTESFAVAPGDSIFVSCTITGTGGVGQVGLEYKDLAGNVIETNSSQPVISVIGNFSAAGPVQGTIQVPSTASIATATIAIVGSGYSVATACVVNTPVEIPSGYYIDPSSVSVNVNSSYYRNGIDFLVSSDGSGKITMVNVPAAAAVTVFFTEHYPAYQCSINQTNWSPVIMLDPNRPYPDVVTQFIPITTGKNNDGTPISLPLMDESGNPLGLFISLNSTMQNEYLLRVYQNADSTHCGIESQIEIDFGQIAYMNAIHLEPSGQYPARITQIVTQGFTENSQQTIYQGYMLLDRPMSLKFPTTLVGSVFITVLQENYTIGQYQVTTQNALQASAINDMQSLLPPQARELLPVNDNFYTGYVYTTGFENIQGELWSFELPTIFVYGPWTVNLSPDTIQLAAAFAGDIDFYLCWMAYDANGNVLDVQLNGYAVNPGTGIVFPFSSGTNRSDVASVDIYVKVALRGAFANLTRLLIEVV